MALLGPSTDYTDKDFDALRARLGLLVRSVFPKWTDQDVANFGNILIEAFAFVGDVLTKYQDNQAAEAFWGRVLQRKNIISLAKLIGFTPAGATASQVDLVLTITSGAPTGSVTVAERQRAKTESIVDPVVFETLAEVVFAAGEVGPLVVTSENAELRDETFGASGLPNQELRLSGAPYLDDSAEIVAANGDYEVVENFLESTSTDRHATIGVDSEDRATIRFGNGVNGALPSGTISVAYKVGGGADGIVEAEAISRLDGSFVDEFGNAVRISVSNPLRSSPAVDRQTVEQIRALGPQSLRVLTRTVAREDYEINAKRVPGVIRALMLTSDQDEAVQENQGLLYIVPTGGGVPTTQMKADVLEMVTTTYPRTITFAVDVMDPVYLTVNVQAKVHFAIGATKTTVRAAIQAALEELFAIEQEDGTPTDGVDFGYYVREPDGSPGSIAWSDVLNAVRDVSGVRKVDAGAEGLLLNGVRDDLSIELREFPILGTVVIIDAETELPVT